MRADITDRHGVLIATNLPTKNLYAEPSKILNPEDTAVLLARNFPDLPFREILPKLQKDSGFFYLKRNLTPTEQNLVNSLGLPGIDFENGEKRTYLQDGLFAHVVGAVNVDNRGVAGVERRFDNRLLSDKDPLRLSVDIGVQQEMAAILRRGIKTYRAKGAAGVLMDVMNGQILALVSLPNFNPNAISARDMEAMFNQISLGVYETGSVFKLFNAAMAIDAGTIRLEERFDATKPFYIGRHRISDPYPKNRWLSVKEILAYSSNIGSARIALKTGDMIQQQYMQKFGFDKPLSLELPETGRPIWPKVWRQTTVASVSYGYGLSVTPLHVVAGVAALVNGGFEVKPTLLKRDGPQGKRIISAKTSEIMRQLMRSVIASGSGARADVDGFEVGGKTGSAKKVVRGRYVPGVNRTSFVGAFPMSEPKYALFVLLDEPQKLEGDWNNNAGNNAVPLAGEIIAAVSPILGVRPKGVNSPILAAALAAGVAREPDEPKLEDVIRTAIEDDAPPPVQE